MGFEITYHYHERNPTGGYNTEDKKQLKRKVGKSYDDTDLSQAAKAILAQLARRDIWVIDVELEELVKRKVSFKESKDGFGILLKGKKFTIEDTEGVQVEEYVEDNGGPVVAAAVKHIQSVPQLSDANFQNNLDLTPDQRRRTLFKIIFRPEPQDVGIAKKYRLTAEKKYNVHRQRDNPLGGQFGSVYAITNDSGELVEVDEKYFIIAPQGLVGGEQFNRDFQEEQQQPRLMYQNNSAMPQRRAKVDRAQIPQEFAHLPIEGEEISMDAIPMHNIRPDYTPPKPTRP